jgi:hypothetical protein
MRQQKLSRKLVLHKETIRELTAADLGQVAGGARTRRCPTQPELCNTDMECVPDTFITCVRSQCFGCN